MLIPAEFKVRSRFLTFIIAFLGLTTLSFTTAMDDLQCLYWSNKCLQESYNTYFDQNLKKWDLSVTYDNFLRLRRTYLNGKQEYYSFHLHRFKDVNYMGTAENGTLQLNTIADDIIVQTYKDPKGDVDSMTTSLNLQVKNLPPEKLDSLREALLQLKAKKQN